MKPDLSLVIACYNEESHLVRSVEEIEEIMNQTKYSYGFIFIDDCSKDNTREIIEKIVSDRNNCRYIFHQKNVGRGGTVKEGLLMSASPYAGFLDIDLEVHARYIPSVLLFLEKGNDVVTIDRVERFNLGIYPIIRLIVSRTYDKLAHFILSIKHPDTEAGFKFFNMDTMRSVIEKTENRGWFWDTEIILRAEKAGKKLAFIKGVFGHNPDKKSTVRIIPDSIAQLKAIYKFKKDFRKDNV